MLILWFSSLETRQAYEYPQKCAEFILNAEEMSIFTQLCLQCKQGKFDALPTLTH